ncbi:hypothetical protein CAPTEDRAFT_197729 [Capitella teleta]|uniref:Uncharacterized protein n=1 Tax=Capitella teleta TaxID=283909 RepID=R7TZJ8_CAPTE|nr:hypothetical protein CAPTEDRAFT_197729 [Capitella teleta]|eukprot:ELT99072.1 hypothetical protein CAPTEDRAFT_197729 [Capitella teleta]
MAMIMDIFRTSNTHTTIVYIISSPDIRSPHRVAYNRSGFPITMMSFLVLLLLGPPLVAAAFDTPPPNVVVEWKVTNEDCVRLIEPTLSSRWYLKFFNISTPTNLNVTVIDQFGCQIVQWKFAVDSISAIVYHDPVVDDYVYEDTHEIYAEYHRHFQPNCSATSHIFVSMYHGYLIQRESFKFDYCNSIDWHQREPFMSVPEHQESPRFIILKAEPNDNLSFLLHYIDPDDI